MKAPKFQKHTRLARAAQAFEASYRETEEARTNKAFACSLAKVEAKAHTKGAYAPFPRTQEKVKVKRYSRWSSR
jgi:hypothetical protein